MAPSPWNHGPQFLIFTNEHRKAMCPKNRAMFSELAKPSYWKLLNIARCNPHCLSLSKPKRAQRQSRDEGYHAGAKSPKLWSTRTLLKCGANADGDLKILVNDSSIITLPSNYHQVRLCKHAGRMRVSGLNRCSAEFRRHRQGYWTMAKTWETSGVESTCYLSFFRSWRNSSGAHWLHCIWWHTISCSTRWSIGNSCKWQQTAQVRMIKRSAKFKILILPHAHPPHKDYQTQNEPCFVWMH